MMRFTIGLFLLINVQVMGAGSYAQETLISLQMQNAKVKDVLKAIEKASEFYFVYNTHLVDVNKTVNVDVRDKQVSAILENLFAEENVRYQLIDRQIVLSPISVDRLTTEVMQEITVSGTVRDKAGQPVPGVTVSVKGTARGTITDFDGRYTLNLESTDELIIFSSIGMKTQEIVVGDQSTVDVVMEEELVDLDEVVVVGYGVQSRRRVTSSISSVEMAGSEAVPASSVSQVLSGKAAGLNVNFNSAQPGGDVTFQIRGAATGRAPLIVIDGMPTSDFNPSSVGSFGNGSIDATLLTINPSDIESIDILKDASATAIYGSKAAGGVILITTKRGKTGDQSSFSVNLNASSGVQKFYEVPEMLNAVDYMNETNRVLKEKWLYDRREGVYSSVEKPGGWQKPGDFTPYYDEATINEFRSGQRQGTDFVDAITRSGLVQDVDLSIQGNSKDTRFYSSFNVYDQKGIIKNNDLSKFIGRVNVNQDFGDKLTAGLTINFSSINSNNVQIGNGGLWENSGILLSALQFDPTLPIYDEDGNYQENVRQSNFPNPVSFLDITNETKVERFFNTADLKYNILPELYVKAQVGFDRTQSRSYGYLPTSTIAGKGYNGRADRADDTNTNYQFQLLVNYIKTFNEKHNLTSLLGTEYMKYKWEGYGITATNFPYDGVLWNNLSLGANRPNVWSYGGSTETASYFAQLSYDYDYKYFVSANLRVDGSANFSPDDQYGFFPGISVGWDISREGFMASTSNWLDQLKLRAGYGETGNDDIGSAFTDWYAPGANTMWGNSVVSGVRLAGLGNPNLKWEKQVDINAGFDFSIFNGRVTGSMEYFNRVISRILGEKNLISSNPVNRIYHNLDAEKQTYGAEVTINTQNIKTSDFSWNSLITYTYYRDRWLKRDPSYVLGINESAKQYFGELWYYQTDGLVEVGSTDPLNPIPGTVKIKDVDGYLLDEAGNRVTDENGKPLYAGAPDGRIDAADLVKVGVNTPYTIGFSNVLRYKNWDMSIDAYGVFNRWKINQTKMTLGAPAAYGIVSIGSNLMEEVKDRWNSDYQDGTEVSALQNLSKYGTGDYYLEKAWFIRVKNITLGYTLPEQLLSRVKMKSLRVYANLMNPFLFTPYSGMDPETDSYVAAYPNQRTYSLGLQLNF
ncbi:MULTISPECIES: SusC/RagA family TonB-linked outer membrane protein [unclassified Carboxylicivirga]|uniref:SusC/RagA family TonB-linked outer membrane protein n=1 Tax=Carboxylicivirga TaxID=1628153 RepID=UPI003D329E92